MRALLATLLLLFAWTASATPMYAQRSGRTCANCHESPTLEDPDGWDDPALAERKCNLSCISCHVDPTGGGMRNTSGRYYGQSTLSMVHLQERSYSDHGREILSAEKLWRLMQNHGASAEGIPSSYEDAQAGVGAGQTGPWNAIGKPAGHPARMAYWDGRYDDLNADPLLSFGLDARMAMWTGTEKPFPMQIDLHGAVHPVEHVTATATIGAYGRSSGVVETVQDGGPSVLPKTALLMVHELPGASWAKVGIFQPAFGMYTENHTAFTRVLFEQDGSQPGSRVVGAEIGTAPNYPFATLSVFSNDASFSGNDDGFGAAASAGYRELGWNLGAHGMMKRRAAGTLLGAGLTWGFNPAYYAEKIPITFVGEVSVGQRDGTVFAASNTEMWWMWKNGLSLRMAHDAARLDFGLRGTTQQRVSTGVEFSPWPGITFTVWGRTLFAAGPPRNDLFLTTHFWF